MRKGLILFSAVWIITGILTLQSLDGTSNLAKTNGKEIHSKGESIAKLCISSIFPTVSRGADFDLRQHTVPADTDEVESVDENLKAQDTSDKPSLPVVDTQKTNSPTAAKIKIDYSKPVVIIYHTHATEGYHSTAANNFRSLEEKGTVREVGDVLTAELEAQGIQVIHNKTTHDYPSYNQSYSRSLQTIQKLISENPTTQIIIDLHRDAAAYTGNVGKTVKINGQTVAKYNLVVGNGNDNAEKLKIFGNQVNRKAEELYPGFGGRIIEKEYKYNQWVSDYQMLLEIGNNENTIDECKLTAKYFAKVLAGVIKEIN